MSGTKRNSQVSDPVARTLFVAAILVVPLRLAVGWGHLQSLGVMLAGAILGELPYFVADLLSSVAPGGSQPYTLFFLLTPLAITYAILRSSRIPR